MLRLYRFTLLFLAIASAADAHFVFIVPEPSGQAARVILSEDLQPDQRVTIEPIIGAQLLFTDVAGHDTPLQLKPIDAHAASVELGKPAVGVVHGIAEYGILQRGNAKPALLIYYPRTIIGAPFGATMNPEQHAPVELVPAGRAGDLMFRLLVSGKPAPNSEVDVITPDGSDQKVLTDKDGQTIAFKAIGRYGAWARDVQATPGERDGKHYDEVRRYATLVVDVPPLAASYAPLPQPASSFGAVACDDWLYVYGGHVANTHAYSTASVSGEFHRMKLAEHLEWETLDSGPPLQGMNLAAWRGKIIRVGGMTPRNQPGEPTDVRSVPDCASFDPSTGKWTPLPPLPEPRSSHDVAIIGDTLLIVGGWNLGGAAADAKWHDTLLILDLSSNSPAWKALRQPFHRRALIAAAYQDKLYAIGGFQVEQQPDRTVEIYDPKTDQWTHGPALPGADQNGFGPAACVQDGRLYVSVADGSLNRLDAAGQAWAKVASTTPRIVHRLVSSGSDLLVIGGAAKLRQLDLIEVVKLSPSPVQASTGGGK